nr:MAG TPA: hypothetical protein [Caudoviricetes sp.]
MRLKGLPEMRNSLRCRHVEKYSCELITLQR